MAISAVLNLEVFHADLKSAFLHEDYKGPVPIYMEVPPHFDGTHRYPGKVAKIGKNILGTPQAPKIYSDGLRKHLEENGYSQLKSNCNVYTKNNSRDLIAIAVTIDDFAVATKCPQLYKELIAVLQKKYSVKDLGVAKHIIGWSINRVGHTLHISQPHLTETFLRVMQMENVNPKQTPYVPGLDLSAVKHGEEPLDPCQ